MAIYKVTIFLMRLWAFKSDIANYVLDKYIAHERVKCYRVVVFIYLGGEKTQNLR